MRAHNERMPIHVICRIHLRSPSSITNLARVLTRRAAHDMVHTVRVEPKTQRSGADMTTLFRALFDRDPRTSLDISDFDLQMEKELQETFERPSSPRQPPETDFSGSSGIVFPQDTLSETRRNQTKSGSGMNEYQASPPDKRSRKET